jgi:hypothetical protein
MKTVFHVISLHMKHLSQTHKYTETALEELCNFCLSYALNAFTIYKLLFEIMAQRCGIHKGVRSKLYGGYCKKNLSAKVLQAVHRSCRS